MEEPTVISKLNNTHTFFLNDFITYPLQKMVNAQIIQIIYTKIHNMHIHIIY